MFRALALKCYRVFYLPELPARPALRYSKHHLSPFSQNFRVLQ
jgi:hypothetical protein